jgi:hypothetical protein
MKLVSACLISLIALLSHAFAGGSIAWSEAAARISRSDPNLVQIITKNFSVQRVGGATRIGSRVDPERAGERVPPYDFNAVRRDTGKEVILKIDQSPDFDFTGRYFFVCTPTPKK